MATPRSPSIHYSVCPIDPQAHLFEVACTIDRPDPAGQVVSMAAWIPGSYMIRDFAKNVVTLRADNADGPLPVEKLDKQTWRAGHSSSPLTFRYQVYCWELSVRGAHLDTTHGYFNGTSLFLKIQGQTDAPCSVELLPPEGDAYREWRVATTLPSAGASDHGFGTYRADDYEELVDHPVEMGAYTLVRFEADGVPHEMALTGRHRADTSRLARDLKRVCEYHIGLFGEAPMERYLFQVMAVGDGYGGLEHRSSTSLLCKRDDLPGTGRSAIDEGYRTFLGLCSHEYFHTWNVKRIKPASFQPYDLSREVHTPLLWAFEGITSYYDDLALARCGLINRESYLELLGQTITRVLRGSGRFRQSVAESSFDAWTKFYKQDENAPNAVVSYYAKGALIALALDLTIRLESGGQRSLDDVMRALWQRHGKPGIGVTEGGLENLICEVADADLRKFFDHAVRGTDDLPLEELLARFGVEFHLRPAASATDKGGKPTSPDPGADERAVLGAATAACPQGARVSLVFEDGAAQRAGLAAGDVIIAIDGLRAEQENLERLLGRYRPGDTARAHAFRRDELLEFSVTLQAPPHDTCYLTVAPTPDARTRSRLESWLG